MCLSQEIEEPPATLNASAHEQCKPESSAVVNLLCQPADNLHHRYCWCYCKEINVFVTRNQRTKQSWSVVNAVNSSLQSRESTTPLTKRTIAAAKTAVPGLVAAAT